MCSFNCYEIWSIIALLLSVEKRRITELGTFQGSFLTLYRRLNVRKHSNENAAVLAHEGLKENIESGITYAFSPSRQTPWTDQGRSAFRLFAILYSSLAWNECSSILFKAVHSPSEFRQWCFVSIDFIMMHIYGNCADKSLLTGTLRKRMDRTSWDKFIPRSEMAETHSDFSKYSCILRIPLVSFQENGGQFEETQRWQPEPERWHPEPLIKCYQPESGCCRKAIP